MPPVLHPRSRTTLSLFTTTLILSFAVVGLPHILPCPVPCRNRLYADGSHMPGLPDASGKTHVSQASDQPLAAMAPCNTKQQQQQQQYTAPTDARAHSHTHDRECPIPKPSGYIAQLLGFSTTTARPTPTVAIENLAPLSVTRNGTSHSETKS